MNEQSPPAGRAPDDAAPRRPGLIDAALLQETRESLFAVTQPWWSGERVSENGLIYGANVAGSRPPLLWCFQGYGEFAALAKALGPDQPLYGMRSGHLVVTPTAAGVTHMAVVLAEEIHSLDLPDPLTIGGNCQAALLAQKTAEILMASGRVLSLFIALNPLLFTPFAGRAAFIVGRHDRTNPFIRLHDADRLFRLNYPHATVDVLPAEHGKLFRGRLLELLSGLLRQRLDEALPTYSGSFPLWNWRAELTAPAPLTVGPNSIFEVTVGLRNITDNTWAPSRLSGLAVGNHWRQTDGTVVQWLDGRQPLDRHLAPGESVDLELLVRAPGTAGDYHLEFDVEQAGIYWFSEVGGATVTCPVTVSKTV